MTEDAESNNLSDVRNRENVADMFILEPDIGLGDHIIANRISRNNDDSRREESSISFRRFLQNNGHNNRSVHPDLFSCSRQDRSNEGAAIDPENPDLPDFVQDHIAVEQIYFNNTAPLASANLPDFASFMSRNDSELDSHAVDVGNSRCRNRVPLDLPMPNFACDNVSNNRSRASLRLPFDLTTESSENCNIANNGSRLPDFLSDGHIFGPDSSSHNDTSSSTLCNNVNMPPNADERTSVFMLERDNERLRGELQVLRTVLLKKDDRIKELENIVMALEISKVQMQTDADTQTVAKTNDNDIAVSSRQKIHISEKPETEHGEVCSNNSRIKDNKTMNPNLALKVKEMTNVSERLVRDLLKIITDFQVDIDKENSIKNGQQDVQAIPLNSEEAANMCSPSSSRNSTHPK